MERSLTYHSKEDAFLSFLLPQPECLMEDGNKLAKNLFFAGYGWLSLGFLGFENEWSFGVS